jgi:hypothetical protein
LPAGRSASQPERLETALAAGADAVIDSSREDVMARLTTVYGRAADALGQPPLERRQDHVEPPAPTSTSTPPARPRSSPR